MLILWSITSLAQLVGTSQADYLNYCEGTAQEYMGNLTEQLKNWRKQIKPDPDNPA